MRVVRSFPIYLLVLACITGTIVKSNPRANGRSFGSAPSAEPAPQVRQPDAPVSQPGTWVQPAVRHSVDVTQLRSEAQELVKTADAIPARIDLVASGQLPKDLIDNLKKIEKLSKRLRGEVSF